MTEELKQNAPLILEAIKNSKRILLHCHPSPDPDSIGGVLAMGYFLKSLSKDFTIISGDSEPPKNVKSLPGYEWIQSKNYLEIKPSDYDLFLIQDTSSLNQITKKGEVVFPESMTTVVIDHHATNQRYGKINLVDENYPSVCQMIYDLFKEWSVDISPEMAINLFLGMYTDTGGFKYPTTTFETLLAASECARLNPNFPKIIFEYENSNEPQQILCLALALNSIENYFSGNVAVASIPYVEFEKRGIQRKHTEKMEVSNILKSVVGWNIGINFMETEPGKISCSFRTRDSEKYDVSKIASSLGQGGGHKAAAGTTIYEPFDKAKKSLLETIAKIYPELGQP